MSQNRFKIDRAVKSVVEWKLERFHEDKRMVRRMKEDLIPAGTARYDQEQGHASIAARTTENVTMKIMNDTQIRNMEESVRAIEKVLSAADGITIELIELVYWKKSHTVTGAGMEVGLAQSAAYERINTVLAALALEMGYGQGVELSKTGKKDGI